MGLLAGAIGIRKCLLIASQPGGATTAARRTAEDAGDRPVDILFSCPALPRTARPRVGEVAGAGRRALRAVPPPTPYLAVPAARWGLPDAGGTASMNRWTSDERSDSLRHASAIFQALSGMSSS